MCIHVSQVCALLQKPEVDHDVFPMTQPCCGLFLCVWDWVWLAGNLKCRPAWLKHTKVPPPLPPGQRAGHAPAILLSPRTLHPAQRSQAHMPMLAFTSVLKTDAHPRGYRASNPTSWAVSPARVLCFLEFHLSFLLLFLLLFTQMSWGGPLVLPTALSLMFKCWICLVLWSVSGAI